MPWMQKLKLVPSKIKIYLYIKALILTDKYVKHCTFHTVSSWHQMMKIENTVSKEKKTWIAIKGYNSFIRLAINYTVGQLILSFTVTCTHKHIHTNSHAAWIDYWPEQLLAYSRSMRSGALQQDLTLLSDSQCHPLKRTETAYTWQHVN